METTEPIDLYVTQIVATVLLSSIFLFPNSIVRKLLGIPFILFFPGYNLTALLFPTKPSPEQDTDAHVPDTNGVTPSEGIGWIERLSLSFGLSFVVVILIGLGLNYTPWGIRLLPVLGVNYLFISLTGVLAIFRRRYQSERERLQFKIGYFRSKKVTFSLGIAMILIISSVAFLFMDPRQGETYTEFYLLGPGRTMDNYPTNMTVSEQGSVIIGVENHEYKKVPYRIEVWAINKSGETFTTMDLFGLYKVTLEHWGTLKNKTQWETNYTFTFRQIGTYKLVFLLFRLDEQNSSLYKEEKVRNRTKAENHVNSSYRHLHLWVNVEQ